MAEKEIMSALEVSKILGCSPQMVREMIKRGIWKFGEFIPPGKNGNKKHGSYFIYRSKLYKHIGRTED